MLIKKENEREREKKNWIDGIRRETDIPVTRKPAFMRVSGTLKTDDCQPFINFTCKCINTKKKS